MDRVRRSHQVGARSGGKVTGGGIIHLAFGTAAVYYGYHYDGYKKQTGYAMLLQSRIIFGLCLVSIWMLTRFVTGQAYQSNLSLATDSLDSKPDWEYESLYNAVRSTLAQHPNIYTLKSLPKRKKKKSDQGVGVEWNAKLDVDSTILTWPLKVRLLAWVSDWAPCNNYGRLDTSVENRLLNHRLLIWSEISNPQTKMSRWTLMVFRVDSTSPHTWEPVFRDLGDRPLFPYSPVKVFSQRPRNIDVYQFVDSLILLGRRSEFDFRYNTDDCSDMICTCSRFDDGDVRENTWKDVIGESPTRFFPNGK